MEFYRISCKAAAVGGVLEITCPENDCIVSVSYTHLNNYRPQFYFRTTDVTGVITLPEGTEMCMPGDNVTMDVELITPIAIEEGLRFAIREGGRTVGSGVVTKINE